VLAQNSMALALLVAVIPRARRLGASLAPHPWRVLAAARDGIPLLIRTLALRAVLLVTTWVAVAGGDTTLAAYQVSATVWTFMAFALDALAIAAQTLTGHALGARDKARARSLTMLMVRWGLLCGTGLGAVLIGLHRVLPALFTTDPAVQSALASGLLFVGLQQPLCGLVFVLDGVLIGAGDGRWLAGAAVAQTICYLPIALVIRANDPDLMLLWCGFAGFMAFRSVLLCWRALGERWMTLGPPGQT
jgi:putative MATE family efflux protein